MVNCLKSLSRSQLLWTALFSLVILFWIIVVCVDIQSLLSPENYDAELLAELNMPNSFLNKTGQGHNYEPNLKEKQGDKEIYSNTNEKNHIIDSNYKKDSDASHDQKSEEIENEAAIDGSAFRNTAPKHKETDPASSKESQFSYFNDGLANQFNDIELEDLAKNNSAGQEENQNSMLDKEDISRPSQLSSNETENLTFVSAENKNESINSFSEETGYENAYKKPIKTDSTFSDETSEINHSTGSSSNFTQEKAENIKKSDENMTVLDSFAKNNKYSEEFANGDSKDLKSLSDDDLDDIESEFLSSDLKIKNPKIQCVPPIYGYTRDQANSRFPYGNKRLFICGDDFNIFTLKDNFFYLNCSSGQYNLGNVPENEVLGNVPFDQRWIPYMAPVNLKNIEFGFARCMESKRQAFLHNKFSEAASERAQEKRKSIESSLNLTSSKPLTVLTVVFDSVSRQHFYRTLTKTVDFMNQNIVKGKFSKKFAIYDFQIEHASGENTLPNIVPLLLGNSDDDHKEKIKNLPLTTKAQPGWLNIQEEHALWRHYERHGFVTMFGWETKWDYLATKVGRKVFADHVVSSFYNAAWTQAGFCDVCDSARCIGNQQSHQFLFNYTKEFINNYKGHNKFSYTHFSHGHEWTGSVIRSIDEDFIAFIKDVLEFYTKNSEDLVLVLTSDHGIHLGSWDSIEEGRIENLLPYSFVVANKEILTKIGKGTHEILSHNTQHITSKFDMHLTLKHLAKVPYENIEKDSPKYNELKSNKPHLDKAVSLFVEKIKDDRTCEDIGNSVYWCACWKYEEKSIDGVEDLVNHIAIQAAAEINERIKRENMQNYCSSSVEFEKVISLEYKPIDGIFNQDTGLYKIKFAIKNHPDVLFSAQAIAVPEKIFPKFEKKNMENYRFPISIVYTNGQQYKTQVQYIERADEKKDICIELEESIGGKIAYCICQKPKDYKFSPDIELSQKKLYEKLVDSVSVVVGKNGTSCTEVCRAESKLCIEWGLQIMNQYPLLNQPWSNKNSYKVLIEKRFIEFKSINFDKFEHGGVPGLKHENHFTFVQADWNVLSCNSAALNIQPICSCSKHPVIID